MSKAWVNGPIISRASNTSAETAIKAVIELEITHEGQDSCSYLFGERSFYKEEELKIIKAPSPISRLDLITIILNI